SARCCTSRRGLPTGASPQPSPCEPRTGATSSLAHIVGSRLCYRRDPRQDHAISPQGAGAWRLKMTMVVRHRSMAVAAMLLAMALSGCAVKAPSAAPDGGAAAKAQDARAALTTRAPDGFYDPPASVPNRLGALLRSEPLKDVVLPVGMQG